jgi:hypothetical protein
LSAKASEQAACVENEVGVSNCDAPDESDKTGGFGSRLLP